MELKAQLVRGYEEAVQRGRLSAETLSCVNSSGK